VWQSDLQEESNRYLILNALRAAGSRIEKKTSLGVSSVIIDEATRDASGSPNIPAMIADKILAADAVFCDVTTVLRSAEGAKRRASANPNVIFELGLAVAQHGWDRIVLLFNEAHGEFPGELPFDFDRHRASPFTSELLDLSAGKPSKADLAAENQKLYDLVYGAMKAIIEKDPPRPADLRFVPPELLKRNHDVATLTELMRALHLETMDEFLDQAPRGYPQKILHFHAGFAGILSASGFHLYDERARELVGDVDSTWDAILSIGANYSRDNGRHYFTWPMLGDLRFENRSEQEAWESALAAVERMRESWAGLLLHLRERYPEINVQAASAEAWRDYREFTAGLDARLDPKNPAGQAGQDNDSA
jgi:hypothetical protein